MKFTWICDKLDVRVCSQSFTVTYWNSCFDFLRNDPKVLTSHGTTEDPDQLKDDDLDHEKDDDPDHGKDEGQGQQKDEDQGHEIGRRQTGGGQVHVTETITGTGEDNGYVWTDNTASMPQMKYYKLVTASFIDPKTVGRRLGLQIHEHSSDFLICEFFHDLMHLKPFSTVIKK